MKTRFWSSEAGIGLGVGLLLVGSRGALVLGDPGTFWHTVLGQKIGASGKLLAGDPFSFTFAGRPEVLHEWLGECVMAAIHALFGLDGLLFVTSAALGLLYACLAHRLLRGGLAWPPTVFLILLAVAIGASHFLARPHLATFLGLGLTCARLGDVESRRLAPAKLWTLVPVFVIWANIHGGMLGGFVTLVFVVSGWILSRGMGRDSPIQGPRDGLMLVAIVVLCGLASLVNPYGVRLPQTWFQLMSSPVLPRLIIEQQPMRFDSQEFLGMAVLGLVYLIALLGVAPGKWRATWMVPLLWFVMAMARSRHASLFGVVTLSALADLLPHSRVALWLARPGRDGFRVEDSAHPRSIGRSWIAPAALVALALGLQAARIPVPLVGRGWARLDPDHWPVELLPDLRLAEAERPGGHVFNEVLYGGFLIYYTPGLRVFVDDRCELYGDDWLVRLDRDGRDPKLLQTWLSEYHLDFALLATDSPLDRTFRTLPGWSLVRKTPTATFYRARKFDGRSRE